MEHDKTSEQDKNPETEAPATTPETQEQSETTETDTATKPLHTQPAFYIAAILIAGAVGYFAMNSRDTTTETTTTTKPNIIQQATAAAIATTTTVVEDRYCETVRANNPNTSFSCSTWETYADVLCGIETRGVLDGVWTEVDTPAAREAVQQHRCSNINIPPPPEQTEPETMFGEQPAPTETPVCQCVCDGKEEPGTVTTETTIPENASPVTPDTTVAEQEEPPAQEEPVTAVDGLPVDARGVPTPEVYMDGDPLQLFTSSADDPDVGQHAPGATTLDFQGLPQALTPGDGIAKAIVFLAHWCPYCQQEAPAIVEYLKTYPLPEGTEIIAVSTSHDPSRGNWPSQDWLEAIEWPTPILVDSIYNTIADAYGLTAFPYTVVIDGHGTVTWREIGMVGPEQIVIQLRLAVENPSHHD